MSDAMSAETVSAKRKKCTYEEYAALDDGQRHELIDGVIYDMAAPSDAHQAIVTMFIILFGNYLMGKKCVVRGAPYDIKLDAWNTFQPDLAIICDRKKLTKSGCFGAPDLVIEVLSPSTASRDTGAKLHLYLRAGVREYWIVNPEEKLIFVYRNEGHNVALKMYSLEDKEIPVGILPMLVINLEQVFGNVVVPDEDFAVLDNDENV